jgi:pimeloyl-ACP methyl ester carboxylesterase
MTLVADRFPLSIARGSKAMSASFPSHATSRRVRKSCAGGSTRSSRSSHRRDWIAFARRTWREHGGRLVPDYDLKVARTLQGADVQHLPTLWTHFDALARVPLMVIRGARSDMLASTTLDAMLSRRSELDIAVVADQGHAPLLDEPKLIRRIAAFVASCDVSARL